MNEAGTSARFLRHHLVREVGHDGQSRLVASALRVVDGDARATEVAVDYLGRAGVRTDGAVGDVPSVDLELSTSDVVRVCGADQSLAPAAAALVGAFAAVETIKRVVGAGTAASVSSIPALVGELH